MRVLITGGAGYLGSVMTEHFLKSGYSVTVLDSFRHGVQSLNYLCWSRNLSIVRGDARDSRVLKDCLHGVDIVIPLAALVGVRECLKDETAAWTTNRGAILALLQLASDRKIVFPNTNSGYGTSGEAICTEESPLKPLSIYGASKCDAEKLLMDFCPNATVFRLATVFGMSPRMRWDLMVNDFVWRAVKDRCITLFEPGFRRNFIYIQEVARAFRWAIEFPDKTKHEIFNLGADYANLTKRKLAELIATQTELHILEAPLGTDPDKRDYFVSNEKLEAAGFIPSGRLSLESGIRELIKGAQQY